MDEVKYQLLKDVTGKVTPNRNKKTISVYGNELKVPYPPKKNCNKCYGRGFTGVVKSGEQDQVIMCNKCYPKKPNRI